MLEELAEKRIDQIEDEPFCEVPGCEFYCCTWAGLPRCYPHTIEVIGEGEMAKRYEETHDMTWEEFQRDDS